MAFAATPLTFIVNVKPQNVSGFATFCFYKLYILLQNVDETLSESRRILEGNGIQTQ